MNKDRIIQLLCEAMKTTYDTMKDYPDTALLTEIGFDSISFIAFIVSLEIEYQFEVLDSDLQISNFESVKAIMYTLSKYLIVDQIVAKKVLVCDCDCVLWYGIAGEEKIEFDDKTEMFHKMLNSLFSNGVLLCLCSRNENSSINKAFASSTGIIDLSHFICKHYNVKDKAADLRLIAEELGLSLDSFVFVDDSTYELELVKSFHPEVTVIKADYCDTSFIDEIACLFPEKNKISTELYYIVNKKSAKKLEANLFQLRTTICL